jgi:hypothetical protein
MVPRKLHVVRIRSLGHLSKLHVVPWTGRTWEDRSSRGSSNIDDTPALIHHLIDPVAVVGKRLRIVCERRWLIPICAKLLRGRYHPSSHALPKHHRTTRRDSRTEVSRVPTAVHSEPGGRRNRVNTLVSLNWSGGLRSGYWLCRYPFLGLVSVCPWGGGCAGLPGCPGAHRLRPCRTGPPFVSRGLLVLVRQVLAGRRAAASR